MSRTTPLRPFPSVAVALIAAAFGCRQADPPRRAPSGLTVSSSASGGSGSGSGTTTSASSGAGGGASGNECDHCPKGEFCGYPDGQCGKGIATPVCLPLWNPQSCEPAVPACGCDGKIYDSRCAAANAGVDTGAKGNCQAPAGTFACGASFCAIGKQYCRLTTGASEVAPFCAAPPPSCALKTAGGGGGPPAIDCACILAGDKDCPKCDGSADAGFTASGCQGK